MASLSIYSIPNFIVSIYTLSLGLFVLISKPKAKENQACFLVTLASFFWLFSYGIAYSIDDYSTAFIFLKLGHAGAISLSPAIYYFAILAIGKYRKPFDLYFAWASLIYAFVTISCLYLTPAYMPKLFRPFWGYYPSGEILMLLYALFTFIIAVRVETILFRASLAAKKDFQHENYQRLKYYCLSIGIFIISAIDYLPKFGFVFYPFGYVFVFGFATITSYAIIRHKLLNIDLVIRRSFVYSLLIFALTSIYLSIILISEFFFRSMFGYRSLLTAILASSVIAFSFNPLRQYLQRLIDRYFFKIDAEKLMEEHARLKDVVQKQDHMKSVATLAAGMAHEIKNPLTSIKTFAEYLPDRYEDPDFRDKFKRIVVDEVDRVNNIVKQLLEFAKPQEPELKKVSINTLLDETIELLNSNLLSHGIRVVKNYTQDQKISADKAQLKQAFLNLFLNSIQAMPHGGTLSVSTSLTTDYPASPAGGRLLTTISDTGEGIPDSDLKRVFDPFFTTREDGTGLGLSIVHGIITKHGGKLEIKSKPGLGTTVSVTLKG